MTSEPTAAAALRAAELLSRTPAAITPEKIDWLWAGRLRAASIPALLANRAPANRNYRSAIIAAITTGGEWPCDEGRRAHHGNVIILSAEDGAADTIVPRLMAAGADHERVHIVSAVRNPDGKGQRTFNLQTDIELLERKIAEVGDVALVIVDPVSSYLGKTDSHKNSEVRGVLEPLSDMADRTRVAILTITHFSKTGASNTTKALHRFIGQYCLYRRTPGRPLLSSRMPRMPAAISFCMPRTILPHHRRAWPSDWSRPSLPMASWRPVWLGRPSRSASPLIRPLRLKLAGRRTEALGPKLKSSFVTC